jgi:hypothetical protein
MQLASVLEVVMVMAGGCPIVTVAVEMHPIASVSVTVYVPEDKLLTEGFVPDAGAGDHE